MELSSIFFIWVFLPLLLIIYYIAFSLFKYRGDVLNVILLLFSFVFYLWGGIRASKLMLILVAINFGAGIAIDHSNQTGENNKKRKLIFIAAILFNVLILCFFKYFNMIVSLGEIFSANKGNTLMHYSNSTKHHHFP